MLPSLPPAASAQDWDRLLADDAALRPGVDDVLQRLGLQGLPVRRYGSGSLPVLALGTKWVLKLYPPHEAAHAVVESRVLLHIDGRLPLATPQVAGVGTLDGWTYLLMSQLPGHRLVDVWAGLSATDRDRLADELGAGVAALHALDIAALDDLPSPRWADWLPGQRASAVPRQRARGLDARWLDQIAAFLERWARPPGPEHVLLHTEIMREHLLVRPHDDGWRLSGLFDFEPAMCGEREYEFASIGLFVTCGDPRLLRRLLLAYGWREDELDEALPCRLMAMALLHRYSHLRWYLERLPQPDATTLDALALRWWALDRRS